MKNAQTCAMPELQRWGWGAGKVLEEIPHANRPSGLRTLPSEAEPPGSQGASATCDPLESRPFWTVNGLGL